MPSFEWDPAKAAANLAGHNVSFEAAKLVFDDPFAIDEIDDREDYGEERSNILGVSEGRLLLVSYTERGTEIRLISARLAEPKEKRKYHERKR